jgi:hypothetical protein
MDQVNISRAPVSCRSRCLVSGTVHWKDDTGAVDTIDQNSENPCCKKKSTPPIRSDKLNVECSRIRVVIPAASSDQTLISDDEEGEGGQWCDWARAEKELKGGLLVGWNDRAIFSSSGSQCSSSRSLLQRTASSRARKRESVKVEQPLSVISKSKDDAVVSSVRRSSSLIRKLKRRRRSLYGRLSEEPNDYTHHQNPTGTNKWFVRDVENPSFQTSQDDHVMQLVFYSTSMLSWTQE